MLFLVTSSYIYILYAPTHWIFSVVAASENLSLDPEKWNKTIVKLHTLTQSHWIFIQIQNQYLTNLIELSQHSPFRKKKQFHFTLFLWIQRWRSNLSTRSNSKQKNSKNKIIGTATKPWSGGRSKLNLLKYLIWTNAVMVRYVLRIANFYSDDFLLGLPSHTLKFLTTKCCFLYFNWAYIVFFAIRKQQKYIAWMCKCKHYGEQIHTKHTVVKREGEREKERQNKMVNLTTQFTIDFIGDKNLLEFYTHYIMQRRLLLRVNTHNILYIQCRCYCNYNPRKKERERKLYTITSIVNVWYAFWIKIILQ